MSRTNYLAADALARIAQLHRDLADAYTALGAPANDSDPARIPHTAWEAEPDDESEAARARRLRRWAERARRGEVHGATRIGKRWYATRSALDAYFAARPAKAMAGDDKLAGMSAAVAKRGAK